MKSINQLGAVFVFALMGSSGCGMDDMMPNPPTDLKVVELQGGAHATWKDNSDNEGGFMLERKVGTGAFATYKSLDFNTTQFHDTDVKAGTTYGYRVMAMPKSGGHSADAKYSNEVTFSLPSSGTGQDAGAGGGRDAAPAGTPLDAGAGHPHGHM